MVISLAKVSVCKRASALLISSLVSTIAFDGSFRFSPAFASSLAS